MKLDCGHFWLVRHMRVLPTDWRGGFLNYKEDILWNPHSILVPKKILCEICFYFLPFTESNNKFLFRVALQFIYNLVYFLWKLSCLLCSICFLRSNSWNPCLENI